MERRNEQLEKEAEQIRLELADSIEMLRHRLSLSNLVASLPVAVFGGGVAWVLLRRGFASPKDESVSGGPGNSHSGLPRFLSPSFLITGLGFVAVVGVLARRLASDPAALLEEKDSEDIARSATKFDTASVSAR